MVGTVDRKIFLVPDLLLILHGSRLLIVGPGFVARVFAAATATREVYSQFDGRVHVDSPFLPKPFPNLTRK